MNRERYRQRPSCRGLSQGLSNRLDRIIVLLEGVQPKEPSLGRKIWNIFTKISIIVTILGGYKIIQLIFDSLREVF
jgi:hypothetical protein